MIAGSAAIKMDRNPGPAKTAIARIAWNVGSGNPANRFSKNSAARGAVPPDRAGRPRPALNLC